MNIKEGVPFVKFMMLLSSMAPLFVLVALRGIDEKVISVEHLTIIVLILVVIPFLVLFLRIGSAKRNNDIVTVNISANTNNKDYLFTYLFTVLLPLYSFTITSNRDAIALLFALTIVLFVLWNMNLHFINLLFACRGYKVYTLDSFHGAVLLSTRYNLSIGADELTVHRLSNSVFIEIANHNYGLH